MSTTGSTKNNNYKVYVIASGSSGNCTLVSVNGANILIDAGISCKRIEQGLISANIAPESIDAIFVTHEHIDHVSGLRVFEKRYHKKIYTTAGTAAEIDKNSELSGNCEIEIISQFSENFIKNTSVCTFMTDHDAAESIGVSINSPAGKISLATDLGYVNKAVMENLRNSNVLIFESNYDEDMLLNGTYPWNLKKRIMGKRGHLSNKDSAEALLELNWEGLKHVYIAHISRENNTHEIALSNAVKTLKKDTQMPELLLTWHDRPAKMTLKH